MTLRMSLIVAVPSRVLRFSCLAEFYAVSYREALYHVRFVGFLRSVDLPNDLRISLTTAFLAGVGCFVALLVHELRF